MGAENGVAHADLLFAVVRGVMKSGIWLREHGGSTPRSAARTCRCGVAVLAGAEADTVCRPGAVRRDAGVHRPATGAVVHDERGTPQRRPDQRIRASRLTSEITQVTCQNPIFERHRVIAVDGKTLRGSAGGGEPGEHLLAALDHAHGAVLGQVEAGAKTNEIPMFPVLLDRIDITGAVVTADAMHAQRGHATYLAGRGAHYVLTVRRNQPGLFAQLAALPWRQVPVAHDTRDRGHGRDERRVIKVTAVAAGLAFPHAAQAIQIVRRRRISGKKKWSRETVYAITSLTATHASPAELAAIIRGALGDRGTAALGPRHGLLRRPFPGPHRQRPPRHGRLTCPSYGWPAMPASPPPCATTPDGQTGHYERS